MDGLQINQKIRYGYAKAAQHLGEPFSLYRSSVPIDPIQDSNLVGTILAVMTQSWTWMKANRPGNAIWYSCVDAQASSYPLAATVGDYLVGDKTFYVLSLEYQMPCQMMECNRIISLIRPNQNNTAGAQGYVGYTPESSLTIATNMPASVLKSSTGSPAPSKLPTDTKQPEYIIQLPNLGNVEYRVGDIIIDDTNEEYVVMLNEMQEFGWRIIAQQVVNSS